jgi:non-specific serine/threonine protein kinase
MSSQKGDTVPSKDMKESSLKSFLAKLRKRHIIETLAAFIGGGWLLVEVVERLLVGHYKFPEKSIDLTVVSVIGALLSTLVWRWFNGTKKRPGNVKVEVLIVPLVILVTLAIDLNLIFQMAGISGKKLLIGIVAFLLGIAWLIFKLSQWAASMPEAAVKQFDISKLAEIKPEKSIVVLPFADLSPQKDQEYFCDGMTEEIITDLSHVHELLVISRSSAMTFRGTTKKIPEIAGELKTRYVLEGSVRKAGNDLRIAAQLIDATNDAHIWAEKYSGTLNDVFDIQENVSRSIVKALKLMLTSEEKERLASRPIDNVAAYECYLKANAEVNKMTGDAINRAIRNLQNALDIIGDNALLYSGMAHAYLQLVNVGIEHEECLARAEEFAKKALSLDQGFAKAHAMLGWIACWSDPRAANNHFKKAFSISPDDPLVLLGFLIYYVQEAGRIAAAARLLERLVQVDPLDLGTKWMQGGIHFYNGEYSLALPPWQNLYDIYPENPFAQFYLAAIMVYLGQLDSAFFIIDKSASATPSNAFTKLGLMLKYAKIEDKDKTFSEMTPDFQKTCHRDITFSHHLAGIFSLLGEKNEAFAWLENAFDRGFINWPLLAEKDPWLANIRGEPRFKKLMERVKYEWEHFEV